jgi:signal transduction histidine kinase
MIKGLIDDLLDLSKIELGKMDLVMESFDFNDFIKTYYAHYFGKSTTKKPAF